jgi:hypothetical protein
MHIRSMYICIYINICIRYISGTLVYEVVGDG